MRDDTAAGTSLTLFAQAKLDRLEADRRLRVKRGWDPAPAGWRGQGTRRLIDFSSNDTLGLARDSRLARAAANAAYAIGTGAGASPLVTGRHPLLTQLEDRLAAMNGREACLLFSSGYLVALGVIPALMGPKDLILIDQLAHNCLQMGARLSGAAVHHFPNNDMAALAALLGSERDGAGHCLIVTDSLFSMDGDFAPLTQMADLARDAQAWLLADDAHATGIITVPGSDRVDVLTGTLSKALGAQGGFVCAVAPVIALLRNRARSHVYATALNPPSAAAALEALDIMATAPNLSKTALEHARFFCRRLGLPKPDSHIVPILLGSEDAALAAQESLEDQGFLAVAIRPPTVPARTARLRLSFSAAHHRLEVTALADAVADLLP